MYRPKRFRVMSHSPPTSGATLPCTVVVEKDEMPPFAPQNHDPSKGRTACADAASADARRTASPAAITRNVRITELLPRANGSVRRYLRVAPPPPFNSALKSILNVPYDWPRYCGRNPNITTRPAPTGASIAAAFPAIASSPCR